MKKLKDRKTKGTSGADDQFFIDWIKSGLAAYGKSRSGLAKALNLHPAQVTKMLSGRRSIKAAELSRLAAYLESPLPLQKPLLDKTASARLAPVVAEAAADVWIKADKIDSGAYSGASQYPRIPFVPDPHYEDVAQFAVKVVDGSVNDIVRNGSFAICVPYWSVRPTAISGDLVLVERKHRGLVEASIRRIRWARGEWQLHLESSNPKFQERIKLGKTPDRDHPIIAVSKSRLRLVGLVIWKIAPVIPDLLGATLPGP